MGKIVLSKLMCLSNRLRITLTPSEDIYREPTFKMVTPFGFGSPITDTFVVECKGHPRDGFLVCRQMDTSVNLVANQPLFIDTKDERVDKKACIDARTVSVIYKQL